MEDSTDNNDDANEEETTEVPDGNQSIPGDPTPDDSEEDPVDNGADEGIEDETPEESLPPSGNVICTGNILISSPSDMQYYENCTEIDGNLTIDCPELIHFDFAYLTAIHGNLTIQNGNGFFTLGAFGVLNHVAGDITISNNPSLIQIEGLANLTSVEGNLVIVDSHNLTDLSGLEFITSVAGRLKLPATWASMTSTTWSPLQALAAT